VGRNVQHLAAAADRTNQEIAELIEGKALQPSDNQADKEGKKAGDEVTAAQRETAIRVAQESALAALAIKKAALDQEKALDEANSIDLLRAYQELEWAKRDILFQAIDQKIALYQYDKDKFAELEAEKARIQQQYLLQSKALTDQTVRETAGRYIQNMQAVTGSLTSGLQEMVRGHITTRQLIQNIGWAMVDDAIKQGITIVGRHVATEAAKTAATTAGASVRTATETEAGATSIAISAMTAVKNIAIRAWEAAASVYASIAAIPYVGPYLAPAMAAGAVAAVFGMARNISSAAGGWEVPDDQMAMVHKNEMVLPSHLSDRIRNMTDEGKGGPATVNFTVQALDSRSVAELFERNGETMAQILRDRNRNFNNVGVTR
jgi:hypothetical protein